VPGAALAALLQSSLIKDPHPTHPPFKFSIIVGGFKSVDPAHDSLFPIDARSVHIVGRGDVIVDEGKFYYLAIRRALYLPGRLLATSPIPDIDRRIQEPQGGIPPRWPFCTLDSSMESILQVRSYIWPSATLS
jgi:hypothetical protein